MSFIISRGYAKVQILKTSESDPLSFWNILICICPNSGESKTEKAGRDFFFFFFLDKCVLFCKRYLNRYDQILMFWNKFVYVLL